jgi:hypothetical protein
VSLGSSAARISRGATSRAVSAATRRSARYIAPPRCSGSAATPVFTTRSANVHGRLAKMDLPTFIHAQCHVSDPPVKPG